MHTHISPRWWTLLAIGAMAAGLILLESWGTSDSGVGRVTPLFLLLYGTIVLWWRLKSLVLMLKPSMVRAVRRLA